MNEPSPIARRVASFRYAFRGIAHLFVEEPNARIHAAVAVAVLILGIVLGASRIEFALLVGCIGLVFSLEALNSALEALADRVAPEPHPLVERAKDTAAGAVLLAALASVVVGLLTLGPRLLSALGLL